jgi:hypothetical protein
VTKTVTVPGPTIYVPGEGGGGGTGGGAGTGAGTGGGAGTGAGTGGGAVITSGPGMCRNSRRTACKSSPLSEYCDYHTACGCKPRKCSCGDFDCYEKEAQAYSSGSSGSVTVVEEEEEPEKKEIDKSKWAGSCKGSKRTPCKLNPACTYGTACGCIPKGCNCGDYDCYKRMADKTG